MDYHDITLSVDGGIARITLCRPRALNALSMRLRDELESALALLVEDPSTDLVVITGSDAFFSAGFDLKEAAETRLASFQHRILEFHEAIYKTELFIVSAVSGIALAGGFDLALAGDLIFASDTASFGHVEVNFGINPLVFPLAKRVGTARAVDLCATGRIVFANEAHRLGIVNEVLPLDGFQDTVRSRVESIARIGRTTLSGIKAASLKTLPFGVTEALSYEFSLTERLLAKGDVYDRLVEYLTKIGILK